jgi:hypothetical protein
VRKTRIAFGVLVVACYGRSVVGQDSTKLGAIVSQQEDTLAPPRPTGCPANRPPEKRTELDTCIKGLSFDTIPTSGDEQRLLLLDAKPGLPCHEDSKQRCSYGPLARIEPVRNAHKYSPTDLKEGRFIARLFLRRGEAAYPKLGLVPGHTTYWWVQFEPGRTKGQSRFITDVTQGDRLVTPVKRDLTVTPYPNGTLKQALARWYWTVEDEVAQGHCGSATCK